jgi:TetR/AcrR family transcriptional regulator, regulator of autoinduction and epiphytic fitness
VRHVAEVFVDSSFSVCIPAPIEGAELDPGLRNFHHRYAAERRQSLVDMITKGIAEGAIPANIDPELAALALVGPFIYRRLISPEPFQPERASELVRIVLGDPQR